MIKPDPNQTARLSDVLIAVLVCPLDHADLEQVGDELVCVECDHRYPIENGTPNMLITSE